MPRKTLPVTNDWASLLQRELTHTTRPEGGKTIDELAAMRKKAKLPAGPCTMQRWLAQEMKEKRVIMVNGSERVGNRVVHRVFYTPVKK